MTPSPAVNVQSNNHLRLMVLIAESAGRELMWMVFEHSISHTHVAKDEAVFVRI